MHKNTNLAVIIPCYNEIANVAYFRQELSEFIKFLGLKHPAIQLKVIIVNNNSNDGTTEALLNLVDEFSPFLQVIDCSVQGYGAALKAGFSTASGADFVGFCDFDNTYPLLSFPELLQKLVSSGADMVYGARLHADSQIDRTRHIGNQMYVSLLRLLTNSRLTDVCSGMRIFRRERLTEILALTSNELSFSIELTTFATLAGWKLEEHPILYRERIGTSKLSVVRDGFKFLFVLLRLRVSGKQ